MDPRRVVCTSLQPAARFIPCKDYYLCETRVIIALLHGRQSSLEREHGGGTRLATGQGRHTVCLSRQNKAKAAGSLWVGPAEPSASSLAAMV